MSIFPSKQIQAHSKGGFQWRAELSTETPRVRFVIHDTCVYKKAVKISYPVSCFSVQLSPTGVKNTVLHNTLTHIYYTNSGNNKVTLSRDTHFRTRTQTVAVQHTAHLMAGLRHPPVADMSRNKQNN